eukprot:TRINITY_DN400_c1_g1_i2.p2 TRINITY_DN400_c1_g1~~TRINITY_DN400_c1_g1_i2.p2  ORF type:complete len:139 (+),score=45.37 TRINITY_DN400_c1_g1_i2:66-482(+)
MCIRDRVSTQSTWGYNQMEPNKYAAEGTSYMAKGDKDMKPGFFKKMFSNAEERKDSAKDSYQKAANCFKLAKQFDKAAQAYMKTVDCESDEALSANLYVEAAGCMKKVNTSEAVKIMEKAIEAFCSTGGIRMIFKLFL